MLSEHMQAPQYCFIQIACIYVHACTILASTYKLVFSPNTSTMYIHFFFVRALHLNTCMIEPKIQCSSGKLEAHVHVHVLYAVLNCELCKFSIVIPVQNGPCLMYYMC